MTKFEEKKHIILRKKTKIDQKIKKKKIKNIFF